MNVIGARPDGWWRDRDGAVRRLAAGVGALVARTGGEATVVLDARIPAGTWGPPGVRLLPARRRGRDAADDEIVALVAGAPDASVLRVVTSDARLADRVRSLGAVVEGAGRFRARLEAAG